MRSNTPEQNGGAPRRSEGRAVAGAQSTSAGRATDSISESQRTDTQPLRPLKLLRFIDVRERTGLSRSTVRRL